MRSRVCDASIASATGPTPLTTTAPARQAATRILGLENSRNTSSTATPPAAARDAEIIASTPQHTSVTLDVKSRSFSRRWVSAIRVAASSA
jgi:hypothetical protein